ncbi:MAG: hypothetical protein ACKVS6_05180 [Planctomycetota bacterium]
MNGNDSQPVVSMRKRAAWIGLLVFLISSLLVFDANDGNTDSEIHFQQIRAMAERGSFAFEPDSEITKAIIRWESTGMAAGAASQKGADGRVYGHFGVYYVLCGTPFYAIGRILQKAFPSVESRVAGQPFLLGGSFQMQDYFPRLAVTLMSPLFLALAAAAIFLASCRLGAGTRIATILAFAYAYATFAGVHARHCGSDTMAAGLLAIVLERALAARDGVKLALLHAGIAAGLLFGARYLAIAVLPGAALICMIAILRRNDSAVARMRGTAAALIPFVLLASAVLYLNHVRWGSAFDFGYRHSFDTDNVVTAGSLSVFPQRLFLSFFAPSRGLVFFAMPVVLLGIAGLAILWRRERWVGAALLLGVVSTAVPPSLSIIWNGTWSWGPRYHLACVVFFAPAAAVALSLFVRNGGFFKWLAILTIVAGAMITFPALVTSPFGFLTAATESLRIEKPASSLPEPYKNDEAFAEADRQEFLPAAPFSSPYNAIRGLWYYLYLAVRGRDSVRFDELFNITTPLIYNPKIIEHRPAASPWWRTLKARLSQK